MLPFAQPRQWTAVAFVGAYFLAHTVLLHLDMTHGLLAVLLIALYCTHDRTRRFLATFFPMLIYLLIYDSLHLVPRSFRLPVHVDLLYHWDAALFGIPPHEWFRTHHWPVADFVAAVTYSLHFIGPLGFGLWLWCRTERDTTARFAWAFCALNLASLAIQILLPTAPPWYANQYGFHPADPLMAGDAAGLLRVDVLLGRPYFAHMYGMSAVVFGAMPSMHAAWPVLMLCFSRPMSRPARGALIGYGTLMWCSAVYLQHHFVVDLLVGGAMAVVTARCIRSRKSYT